jgi:hypothetical protein
LRSLFDVHVFGPAALIRAALPGDPAKAASAIIAAIDSPVTPLRLPLGDDAAEAISSHLDGVRAELSTWEKIARDTRLETLA